MSRLNFVRAAVLLLLGAPMLLANAADIATSAVAATAATTAKAASCTSSRRFAIGGSWINLAYDEHDFSLDRTAICGWVMNAAHAVQSYYGRYPVAAVQIELKPTDGARVAGGSTYGQSDFGMPLISIRLGRTADQATLNADWVMTHEMVHLSVPSVHDNSHWLEEGIATYVEPIARTQLGQLTEASIWRDMRQGMPKGLPATGDRGLDHTPTWGRTYWGGALFCLIADVEIRQRTGNRMGLQDALRGVLADGGNIEHDWSVMHLFETADAAIGAPVLTELYRRLANTPAPATDELETLWQQLGVDSDADGVHLSDDAPLASIRRAISAPPVVVKR